MRNHDDSNRSGEVRTYNNHTWGTRSGRSREIVEQISPYLQEYPANFGKGVDTLLEMIQHAYTELNSAETPEFMAIVNPLDQTLRSLVDTDGEADEYVSSVFELCTAYERQSYIEGMKVGVRLMMGAVQKVDV